MKKKNEKPNDMQTALDCAIRDYEHNKEAGYIIKDTQYFNYICNQEWEKYLNDMKPWKVSAEDGIFRIFKQADL